MAKAKALTQIGDLLKNRTALPKTDPSELYTVFPIDLNFDPAPLGISKNLVLSRLILNEAVSECYKNEDFKAKVCEMNNIQLLRYSLFKTFF